MDTINVNESTILLAIISSGLLSTVIVFVGTWIKDVLTKREQEKERLFKIRENAYREVLKNIDFIYSGVNLSSEDIMKKKNDFLLNYRLMFLYSSDEIIIEINNILDTLTLVPVVDIKEMAEKKRKIAHSMVILRRQLIKDTRITEDDFRHVT
ncbi:MAG: hypothetical protein AUK06_01785 [Parcubacteria group bacterium CG2_30_36_18]|nr:MAG: hypothetical protein AUK06_01785 [Parcubacteria group bacterium CG2_30_36_18]